MRPTYIFIVLVILVLALSCHDFATGPTGPYDSMVLERTGAGDLAFNVIPLSPMDSFHVQVTHLEFRDTTVILTLVRSEANALALDALSGALSGTMTITGDFQQSRLPAGTWVKVYMSKGQGKFEVTNVDLRNKLLPFEQLVRYQLGIVYPLAP